MIHFKTPRFTLPAHPNTNFDEEEFLSYLQGSLSWNADEKRKIVKGIPSYTQDKVDELKQTMLAEKANMLKLIENEKYGKYRIDRQRKEIYYELMQPELLELYLSALQETVEDSSPYGVHDLTGSIYQMTISEKYDEFTIKGGSWFSANPKEECKAWAEQTIKTTDKRMDIGFRCVKPIFSKEDLPDK